jgi:hypothetical protein
LFVAHHNEGAERKSTTTFDDLGRAVDMNHLLDEAILRLVVVALVPRGPARTTTASTVGVTPGRAITTERLSTA